METAVVKGEMRELGGRHANDRLRQRGLLPAVIYGHMEPPEYVSLSLHDFELALHHAAHVIKLLIDGRERQYLIKDVQYDHLQKTPVHIDLMRVDVTEKVHVHVPLEFRGTPMGVAHGGTLVQIQTELEVECLVLQIPDSIRVNVEHLGLNDALFQREVTVPENVKVLGDPDAVIAVVHPPRGGVDEDLEATAEAGEGASEPEVIGKGKSEDEEGGE